MATQRLPEVCTDEAPRHFDRIAYLVLVVKADCRIGQHHRAAACGSSAVPMRIEQGQLPGRVTQATDNLRLRFGEARLVVVVARCFSS